VPIVPPELPARALAEMRHGVGASGRFPSARGAVSLSLPHTVFTAGLKALAAGRPLREASMLTAWRALLEEDRTVVAAAEVLVADEKAAASSASINWGPFVQSTIDGLEVAERDERVASICFDIRLLRVAALNLVALWLHDPEAQCDVFIPLAPAPSSLRTDVIYDAEQFESEVESMAKRILCIYEAAARPEEPGL
jgi:hypothetical protein